jgi:hypothetical protein
MWRQTVKTLLLCTSKSQSRQLSLVLGKKENSYPLRAAAVDITRRSTFMQKQTTQCLQKKFCCILVLKNGPDGRLLHD